MRDACKWLGAAACLALAAGCSLVGEWQTGTEPAATEPALNPEAELVFGYLETLERLHRTGPAEQAEVAESARRAALLDPTTSNRLRLALILGLPGHVASDPSTARTELGELLAEPERMLPAETALAKVMYQDVNARLALESENRRLVEQTERDRQEGAQALNRRLQAQAAENARLKQDLEEALAKLEAIAALERSLAERDATPRGGQP
jgi:hypothetical protein